MAILTKRYCNIHDIFRKVSSMSCNCLQKFTSLDNNKHALKHFLLYIHSLTPRRYNPCRVLADLRSCLHSYLSPALALQFLTPKFSASFVTPSIHPRLGLPARLLPSGLSKVIFLHGRLSCIHITCPAHLSLVILIVVTRSAPSYKRYTSSLYLDLHTVSSHMGP